MPQPALTSLLPPFMIPAIMHPRTSLYSTKVINNILPDEFFLKTTHDRTIKSLNLIQLVHFVTAYHLTFDSYSWAATLIT